MTLRMRRVRAGECEALIAFIARLNQPGPQHSLHFAHTEAGIRADIEKGDIDLTLTFWLAEDASGELSPWCGAVGVVRDGRRGWLYGPWSVDADDGAVRAALLGVATAAPDLASLQAFTDLNSPALIDALRDAGFQWRNQIHVMRAVRKNASPTAVPGVHHNVGPAQPQQARALAALHDAVLPHTGLSGAAMLDYASRAGLMLAACAPDGSVLGSLCLAIEPALRESEVEFLAVWPAARRQGVGRSLLQAALNESFATRHYDAVNLCVDGSNQNALGLYTSVGFERLATGVKQFWSQPGR